MQKTTKINHRDFLRKGNKFYAVISSEPLLCSLRYIQKNNHFEKIDGEITFIENLEDFEIFSGRERLKEIMKSHKDKYENDVYTLAKFLSKFIDIEDMGISGSGLIKCYRDDSDIDFVIYGAKKFEKAREAIKKEIQKGGIIKELNLEQLKELYKKRIFANELNFEEFLWHEKRKFNKGSINGRKFDLLLSRNININLNYKKIGRVTKVGKVIKAEPFSYPAYYEISDLENPCNKTKILCWTHTYVGQAFEGENIEVSGMMEEINKNNSSKENIIIVGTSRKAIGEYIKVLK